MAEGARITIDAQLQFRHDVEANWLAADPILKVGEPAYTIGYSDRFKLGDGQSKWSELPYLQLGEGGGGGGSQAYESLAWSKIKNLTSGDASVLAQAYAVKQAYNELKSLIPNLANYYTKEQINALIPSLEGYATESFVNTKIADLINGAPTTLDTLKEIADAFAASQDVIEALDEAIGKKANQSDLTALSTQVTTLAGNLQGYAGDLQNVREDVDGIMGDYITQSKLDSAIAGVTGGSGSLGNRVGSLEAAVGVLEGYVPDDVAEGDVFATQQWVLGKNYALKSDIPTIPSLSGYATQQWVLDRGYLTSASLDALETAVDNNATDIGDHENRIATIEDTYAKKSAIPTSLSDLANDVGYITSAALGGLASESWVTSNFLGLGGGTINGSTVNPLAIDTTASYNYLIFALNGSGKGSIGFYNDSTGMVMQVGDHYINVSADGKHRCDGVYDIIHSGNIGSYNAGSATKLATARTIWGQSFDGTGNITGALQLDNNVSIYLKNTSGSYIDALRMTSGDGLVIGYGTSAAEHNTFLEGANIHLRYGTSHTTGLMLNSAGNVLIGTTTDSGYRLKVEGTTYHSTELYLANWAYLASYKTDGSRLLMVGLNNNNLLTINESGSGVNTAILGGNVGIGTTSPAYKLDVNGPIAGHEIYSFAGWMTLLGIENVSYSTYLDNKNQYGLKIHFSNGVAGAFFSQDGNTYFYGNLTTSGEITALSSSSSSDIRLKNIVSRPTPLTLEDIAKLNVISFKWNHRENDKRLKIGLVAQEVQEILPELVGVDRSNYLTLDYSTFGGVVGVMNTKRILSLEERVEALENENKELRRKIYG